MKHLQLKYSLFFCCFQGYRTSLIINNTYNGNKYLTNANIHYNYGKPIAGDVSGDGEVAVNDVIYVLKYVVGNAELTGEQIALADLSGDGNLTVLDAVLIQSLILEVA